MCRQEGGDGCGGADVAAASQLPLSSDGGDAGVATPSRTRSVLVTRRVHARAVVDRLPPAR